ncbi:P-loop containing nucleoside triphosphate hydrolase protein [Thozetella sp. PMI_491]|nr:P-loop containing nucleoside triphosphate hydrolase protein [Thozetella sp. PMI_491]
MKKFGFGKKKDEESQGNPYAQQPAGNPYAQQPADDPYANAPPRVSPYQQARSNLPSGPRPGGLPGGPRAGAGYNTPPPPYASSGPRPDGGYANEKVGATGGYGGNRYDNNAAFNANQRTTAPSRQGGYGGMGDTETQRDDLFSGAQSRYQQQQQQPSKFGGDDRYGSSGTSATAGGDYGGYGEQRELTEEEREEQEVDDVKNQIRQTKQESLASTQRSLAMAEQTESVATGILARLGAQGERLHNTEKNLDIAATHNRIAEERAKELKTLNRSMFAVHVSNPFTKKTRAAEREGQILAQHQADRETREATRRDAYKSQQRMEETFKNLHVSQGGGLGRASAAERSKYQFEEDDSADEHIDENLEKISQKVGILKRAGVAIGEEVDRQNVLIDRIDHKSCNKLGSCSLNLTSIDFDIYSSEMPRKNKDGENHDILKIGNKSISLEGYLTKKPPVSQPATGTTSLQEPTVEKLPEPVQGRYSKRRKISQHTAVGDSQYFKTRQALPLWKHQEGIRRVMAEHDVLVLVGETGSGKSTQVPQFLFEEDWCQRKKVKVKRGEIVEDVAVGGIIAITQPRRVAATTLAHRVSREAGTPLSGQKGDIANKGLVGYSVRFDHNVPKGTRIKFLTEGMLLQELIRDPHLRQYSAIIVDEIHERSVDVDLLSGFLKQIILGDKAGRGGLPLKVVVMSATANVEGIRNFFSDSGSSERLQAEFLLIEGRQFPVEVIHTPKPVADIQEALLQRLLEIHKQEPLPGDILAFLTGQEEIEAMQKILEEEAKKLPSGVPKLKVFPLFGQLSIEAQHQAFQPIKGGMARKIVLATNIAETSVTVPGVRYVVDCGKAKVKQFRTRLGMESLLAKPISKSSAIQRTGRAGREGPGKCYRLYPEETFESLEKTDLPEILRTDVLGAILTMKARGIEDVLSFPLMDTPDLESIEKALVHLHLLGALGDDGSITAMGRKMVLFPVTAPFAKVLLVAAAPENDCLLEVIDIVSCITSGEDIFLHLHSEEVKEEVEELRKELSRREGDLLTYLTTIQRYASENTDRIEWCKTRRVNVRNLRQAMNIRKQLRGLCLKEGMLEEAPPSDPQPFEPVAPEKAETILKCFLQGFALKTAVLAPDSSYVTTYGKHVVAIHPSSVLHGQKKEAIMFLEHVFTQKNYAKKWQQWYT